MPEPNWQQLDTQHVWHPYSRLDSPVPVFPVTSAAGVRLTLTDGRQLIDGMSSWWCAIHGYNHPVLNQAVGDQLAQMSHVMFGGLTHQPAAELAAKLVELTPAGLDTVFFADSGSVAVEVAMKMAVQYWASQGQSPGKSQGQSQGQLRRQRFLSLRGGYHGDTFGAMSVCDPVTGMHTLFGDTLMPQLFVERPACRFDQPCTDEDFAPFLQQAESHADELAAVILEPVVQGAGGMWFYSPAYLARVRQWCDDNGVLLIADEIATGFGRSGRLFACEHAGISPDIMCVGKALTGGYLTLAATLASREIADVIGNGEPGVFMHGPTFMANPLACSVANASIDLLLNSDWQEKIQQLTGWLIEGLEPCRELENVADVRVLGAIGVVELHEPVDMPRVQAAFVDLGVWVRPFGRLVYLMPPFVIEQQDLQQLTKAVYRVVSGMD